jgi:PAS domain S-box-containing protein
MKYILIIIFILLNVLVYYVTEINFQQRKESSVYNRIHKLQVDYETFMTYQSINADIIYENTVEIPRFEELLKEAYSTHDKRRKESLRKELQKLLLERYKHFKKSGVFQYHIVFPNNVSFLRMHKFSKYGDSLDGVRFDFEKVHKTKEIVRGFSAGKTIHAFRNIYPLFDKNKKYIGAIEISYPSEVLQYSLNNINELHVHFIINKNIFGAKAWSSEGVASKYIQSPEHKDYLLTITSRHKKRDELRNIQKRLKLLSSEIEENMKKSLMFSIVSEGENNYKIISFIPIYSNMTDKVQAWLVSYEDDEFLSMVASQTKYVRVGSFFIFLMLSFFIYRVIFQKNELKKLLDAYDKNVIFSTTDLDGKITHASEAFCEICGYKESELLGRTHNIIRHPDMPDSAFEDMWKTIKSGKTWRGDVKNRRKDGSFYWADSEVEPVFENKHVVSYIAIRHDVTAAKEIGDIQREIIFTMGAIGENRSKETGNHVKRVAAYSELFAKYYGLDKQEIGMLKEASPMHDIGKVAIADNILNKPDKLDKEEYNIMQTHTTKGYNMLKLSDRPLLRTAAIVAYEHHEKWDGSGYPRGLSGTNIHIYGRITAIADVFDALGSDRCYKVAWRDEDIFALLKEQKAKHFDPKLVDIFFDHIDEFLSIRDKLRD